MPFNLSGGVSNLLPLGDDDASMLYSSIWTTGILVGLIILIILIMYPCAKNVTFWQKTKTFLYIIVATFFMLTIHKGTIISVAENKNKNATSVRLLESMGSDTAVADAITVKPQPAFGGSAGQVFDEFANKY